MVVVVLLIVERAWPESRIKLVFGLCDNWGTKDYISSVMMIKDVILYPLINWLKWAKLPRSVAIHGLWQVVVICDAKGCLLWVRYL